MIVPHVMEKKTAQMHPDEDACAALFVGYDS